MKTTARDTGIGIDDVHVTQTIADGVMRVGLGAFVTAAGLIGVWAMACMISGIAKAGGFVALGQGWLTAVTGM